MSTVLSLTLGLLAFSLSIQSFEFLVMLNRHFGPQNFSIGIMQLIQMSRIISAWSAFYQPNVFNLSILLILSILSLLPFDGNFNGGSDTMTFQALVPLWAASLFDFSQVAVHVALVFIGVQSLLSFFIAGLVKCRHLEWWNGKALGKILVLEKYGMRFSRWKFIQNPKVLFFTSATILLFEVLSPLALLKPQWTIYFCVFGVIFNILNAAIFGLNRFVWAWAATYPSLYFCALQISGTDLNHSQ